MAHATREQHDEIFLHCMSLIEKTEYRDGSGAICQILILNDINTILDIISFDDEELKAVYKSTPSTKPRIYLTIS